MSVAGSSCRSAVTQDGPDAGTDVTENDFTPSGLNSSTFTQFNAHLRKSIARVNVPLSFDAGLPGLGLSVKGGIAADVGFDWNFGFGISKQDGAFLDVSAADDLKVDYKLSIPGLDATGKLGFLQIRAKDRASNPTSFSGQYVIDDIKPPSGSYRLRETLVDADRRRTTPSGWVCSFPNAGTNGGFADGPGGFLHCGWGPISTASTPNAQGRDFGNWVPASLTVEKQLWPADDPGRFDLKVNGETVKAAAGDGDKVTISLAPGMGLS